jgi:hypothetical protein
MVLDERRADDLRARRAPGRTATMRIAGFLTICLLAAAVVLIWNARQPVGCTGGPLSCLTAADWGTFIAGVFAPIAFIWLVAAVSIQSQELAEQREELRLTRLEFAENREVMRQQADEARKQAEFIGLQTDILKRQDDDRVRELQSERMAHDIQELADLICNNLSHVPLLIGEDDAGKKRHTLFPGLTRTRDNHILDFEAHLRQPVRDFGIVGEFGIDPHVLRMVELALQITERIIAVGSSMGAAEVVVLERLRLLRLAESLRTIVAANTAYVASAGTRKVVDALVNRLGLK